MNQRPPLTTLFLFLYALATASVAIALVVSLLSTVYPKDEPEFDQGSSEFGAIFGELTPDNDRDKVFGLVFGLAGAGLIAAGVLGFDSSQNAVRSGVIGGGLGLFYAATFYANDAASWMLLIISAIVAVVLAYSARYLESGHPRWRAKVAPYLQPPPV